MIVAVRKADWETEIDVVINTGGKDIEQIALIAVKTLDQMEKDAVVPNRSVSFERIVKAPHAPLEAVVTLAIDADVESALEALAEAKFTQAFAQTLRERADAVPTLV